MNLPNIETLLLQEMEEVKGGTAGTCTCVSGAAQSPKDGGECVCQSGAAQKYSEENKPIGQKPTCSCSSGAIQ